MYKEGLDQKFQSTIDRSKFSIPKAAIEFFQSPGPLGKLRCHSTIAKPFFPYSVQKRPEPQICPKFVPAIVFGGSGQGVQFLCQICPFCLKITVFQILTNFSQIFLDPPVWNPQKQSPGQIWTNLGFGAFLNAGRGRRFRDSTRGFLSLSLLDLPLSLPVSLSLFFRSSSHQQSCAMPCTVDCPFTSKMKHPSRTHWQC